MSKSKINDPHADRESQRYSNPIPSREYILTYLDELNHPASRSELETALQIEDEEQQEALRRRLRAMERDGQLFRNRRGKFILSDRLNLISGRVIGHKDGFGFVTSDNGSEDLYLSPRQMRSVLHGDRVLVQAISKDKRGRLEGVIVEVLERNTQQVVGRYFEEGNVGFVVSDNPRINQDILVEKSESIEASPGQFVVIELLSQPSFRRSPRGKIIEVIGEHMAPGMEIDVAIRSHDIPHEWPQAVLDEITEFKDSPSPEKSTDHKDLRHLAFVTIDGEDAKDFDDAVYAETKPRGGWRLLVAIADVSHYVNLNTELDNEALSRGNSVYFPARVIPMLPEILSNDLCSLKQNVDRLTMICDMAINPTGKITRFQFYPAVINSKARLTYSKVAAMLVNNNKALQARYATLFPHLQVLYQLYKILHKAREKRGAIDFETTETRIIFGEDRKIASIKPLQRNEAHRLIEECMLSANVCAAKFLLSNQLPALYRNHEEPKAAKQQDLRDFLNEMGLHMGGGKSPKPADYAKLINDSKSRADAHLIQTVLLRSMNQALYSPDNVGHFGLAFPAYSHFTSPIRRYPDLLVHRAIRHAIKQGAVETFSYNDKDMRQFGEHCSMTERRADDATISVIAWLKCEYMVDHVGDEFDAIITGVTAFGLFAELTNVYVEGLIHVSSLKNDYYTFDNIRHRLVGGRSGTVYHLGDKIRVKVIQVNLDERKIDLEMI